MLFVLCCDPLEPALPDRSFQAEVAAINGVGLSYFLVDHDALVRGDERCPWHSPGAGAIEASHTPLPGWMITPPSNSSLYDAIASRNVRLISDPDQYRHCHYLPECYPIIE